MRVTKKQILLIGPNIFRVSQHFVVGMIFETKNFKVDDISVQLSLFSNSDMSVDINFRNTE